MDIILKEDGLQYLNIPLNWFAAEDEGRTEDPTEQKKKKSREEGKVAKSAEVVSALVILLPITAIGLLGPFIYGKIQELMIYYLSNIDNFELASFGNVVPHFFSVYAPVVGPIAAIAFVAAILGNLIQVGVLFTTKAIEPKFDKISPDLAKYIKKSFFSIEAVFNLIKSIVKIGIIGVVAFINVRGIFDQLISLTTVSIFDAFSLIASTGFKIMVEAAVIMLALAIPDYFFQRKQHMDSLKMSKHEIKEEYKQTEGDPQIKSRLKERMRDILSSTMIQNVPKSDVVITNPTHFAVALEYDIGKMPAPRVSAKGQDNIALNIKRVARENKVPIVENKPLARGLYAELEVGDMVPEKYFDVLATIIAKVKEFDERDL